MDGNICDRLTADDECGIIAFGTCMLDEKQRRAYWLFPFLADDVAVEEGLEVIIAVVGNLGWVEDCIDVRHGLRTAGTGLVVDYTDALLAADRVGDAVETVDDTSCGRGW